MRYVAARRESRIRETAYRNYVADALMAIAENTSKMYGGSYMKIRYADMLKPQEPEKSGEEIVAEVLAKGGIKVVEDDGLIRPASEDNA